MGSTCTFCADKVVTPPYGPKRRKKFSLKKLQWIKTFCHYMGLGFEKQGVFSNLRNNRFPLCPTCQVDLTRIFEMHQDIERLRKLINHIGVNLVAKTILQQDRSSSTKQVPILSGKVEANASVRAAIMRHFCPVVKVRQISHAHEKRLPRENDLGAQDILMDTTKRMREGSNSDDYVVIFTLKTPKVEVESFTELSCIDMIEHEEEVVSDDLTGDQEYFSFVDEALFDHKNEPSDISVSSVVKDLTEVVGRTQPVIIENNLLPVRPDHGGGPDWKRRSKRYSLWNCARCDFTGSSVNVLHNHIQVQHGDGSARKEKKQISRSPPAKVGCRGNVKYQRRKVGTQLEFNEPGNKREALNNSPTRAYNDLQSSPGTLESPTKTRDLDLMKRECHHEETAMVTTVPLLVSVPEPGSVVEISTENESHESPEKNTKQVSYRCTHCHLVFLSKEERNNHAVVHNTERRYMCEECGKTFNRKTNMCTHVKIMHRNFPKVHMCETCGKRFRLPKDLRVHQLCHTDIRRFPCNMCEAKFKTRSTLNTHKTLIHVGETAKQYVCDQCGKRFINPSVLRRHIPKHTGETPFECQECGKKFSFQSSLQSHFASYHGGGKAPCQHCGKVLSKPQSLNRHIRRYHSDSKDKSTTIHLPGVEQDLTADKDSHP